MEKYKKIVIIAREEKSSWISCQNITTNLAHSYQKLFCHNNIEMIHVPFEFNNYQAFKVATELKKKSIDLIVWCDHHPNPIPLINELDAVYKNINFENRPKLLIHIFGDFVLDCLKWKAAEEFIGRWPIHLITASDRQRDLIESFFTLKNSIVSVSPFPVDENFFNTKNLLSNRQEFRSKYKISSNAKLLLYTGRISYQKNIEALIKIFNSLTYMIDDDCYLLLAGSWDDILLPFFGKYGICGSFYNHISKLLTQKQLKKIIFLGNLNIIELKEVYHASDLFVSLSTYNDEDFGMSPAEALCCGLPCLLSDWAGYSSFKKYSEVVKYVPIEFETIRPTISFSKSRSTLMELISNLEFDESFLHKNSKYSLSSLSIESVSNTLKTTITNINFEKEIKFSENFDKLCLGFYANRNHPFSEKLYREVYQVYGF